MRPILVESSKGLSVKDSIFLYMGSKGGGYRLALDLYEHLEEMSLKSDWIINSQTKKNDHQFKKSETSTVSFLSHARLIVFIIKHKNDLRKKQFIFLMPHPFDFLSQKILNFYSIPVVNFIHDASPHPGDFWPRKYSLRGIIRRSNLAIFLSKFTSDSMQISKTKTLSSTLGTIKRPAIESHSFSGLPMRYVLFIGRGRKYQGVKLLPDILKQLKDENIKVVIAGGFAKHIKANSETYVVDRWISDVEFDYLISNATLVALPYIEASQSGIIPTAHSFGVPVVAFDVGGLSEQIVDGISGYLVAPLKIGEFVSRIIESMGKRWNFVFNDCSISRLGGDLRSCNLD
jgi:glycosyltransferase involved in cell wall biosynthesis